MSTFARGLVGALLSISPILFTVPAAAEDAGALFKVAREWVAQDSETQIDFIAGTRLVDRLAKLEGAEAALWRLRVLSRALAGLDEENKQKAAVRAWIEKHDNEVVYSEPSGEYYVIQDRLWELYEKSKSSPLAEEIAWEAAQTPLAGECEGYLACYTEADLRGQGRYLELYPRGQWAGEALENIYWLTETPSPEDFPLDPSDIATCKQIFDHWRKILAAIPDADPQRKGLEKLAKAYKIK